MKVTIKDYTPRVISEISQKSCIFLRTFSDDVVKNSTPKTPMRTGRLRMDIIKQVLGMSGKIIWGKNYASRMEENQFQNYTTPGTGRDFAKNAIKESVYQTESIAKKSGLI